MAAREPTDRIRETVTIYASAIIGWNIKNSGDSVHLNLCVRSISSGERENLRRILECVQLHLSKW